MHTGWGLLPNARRGARCYIPRLAYRYVKL